MSLKHKIPYIFLSTLLLYVCSSLCIAQNCPVVDSLQVKFEEAVYVYDNGNYEGAREAFTHVMQGAFQHLRKHPEDNDDIQNIRLHCIRYFAMIARDQDDMEASNKWLSVGKKMASKHLIDKESAKYWNNGFIAEQKINEEHITAKERAEALKKWIFIAVSIVAVILAVLLVILSNLFLKLRKTYQYLVQKNEEMALEVLSKSDSESNESEDDTLPALLVQYMAKTKAYLNPDLSLNDLCRDLCTNRTYMSNAFSEMGTNFNAFVNKYRVSEAIALLSSKPEYSLQDVWPVCGFNSQSTFYSSFKNMTGLTPLQFKSGRN